VQDRIQKIPGVSRAVLKEELQNGAVFEVEASKGQLVRGDLARAVVESGWDLNELRPSAMSLEEIFLQLTGSDAVAEADAPPEAAQPPEAPEASA
jgi:ABC-2 type transport system ATP-binding protein